LTKSFITKIKGLIILGLAIVLSSNSSYAGATAIDTTADEYAVKAAYIYNILRFVSWPDSSPLAHTKSLNICLFKEDPIDQYLAPISKKSINRKPIKLKAIMKPSDAGSCHLVFFEDKEQLAMLDDNGTLPFPSDSIFLADDIEFVKNGGLFSFYTENNKVRLGANRTAIANSHLQISSLLLEVCKLHGGAK
jgi:YfiR/HmsC-like